jgi:hypothetical protein
LIVDETTTINGLNSRKSTRPNTSNRLRQASAGRKKSLTTLTLSSSRKRIQQKENLQNAITELLNYFSHRNLDAIVRVIRITLEKLRKRITTTLNYGREKNHQKIHFCFCLIFRSKPS